ncbi:hypothetical protein ABEB36_001853 [Hypothenemus hampei]|uniref:THUMP domain-containing protein n=1 Tax=Hypothenemus hampei TaxID=57062 RepID=A0ABD1FGK9_HYPHA
MSMKRKYQNMRKRPKFQNSVEVNMKGFLCSCDSREKDCVREAYNILNKYADTLWPTATADGMHSDDVADMNPDNVVEANPDDVAGTLEMELARMRHRKHRFQVIDSGAKNILFIKTSVEDPVKLAHHILQEIYDHKQQETRFLIRLIPVETVCKAYIKDIEKAFEPLCARYFSGEAQTFSVVFNHRNNDSVARDETIALLADHVSKTGRDCNIEHKVDLKNAQVSILVEIIRSFAFLAVVPNFCKFKKYNLLAFNCDDNEE